MSPADLRGLDWPPFAPGFSMVLMFLSIMMIRSAPWRDWIALSFLAPSLIGRAVICHWMAYAILWLADHRAFPRVHLARSAVVVAGPGGGVLAVVTMVILVQSPMTQV